jgi:hypothetical protein
MLGQSVQNANRAGGFRLRVGGVRAARNKFGAVGTMRRRRRPEEKVFN